MQFNLDRAISVLARTPAVLRSLLSGLDEAWIQGNEGPDTWSAFDNLGHLIHGEKTDWIPRTRIILEHGPDIPFTPFDRFAQFEASQGHSLEQLLDEFEELRQGRLEELRALELTSESLELIGAHPELGRVTLGQLLAVWVVHDLGHIAQITRVMAKQYGGEIGPWKAYLPIVQGRSG